VQVEVVGGYVLHPCTLEQQTENAGKGLGENEVVRAYRKMGIGVESSIDFSDSF
jgi:hypothetical protein